eukprot:scaffold1220_cov259-Pinguiococcus_pyrenoidosus.AAC.9
MLTRERLARPCAARIRGRGASPKRHDSPSLALPAVLLPRPRRRVDLVPQVFHQVQHPVRHKQHRVVLQGKERPLGQVVAVLGRLPTCRPVGDDVQGPGCPAAGNWLDRQHRHPEEFKEFLRGFRAVAAGVQGVMLLEKLETPAGLAKGASLAPSGCPGRSGHDTCPPPRTCHTDDPPWPPR